MIRWVGSSYILYMRASRFSRYIRVTSALFLAATTLGVTMAQSGKSTALEGLIQKLHTTSDLQFRLDILRGVREALAGQRKVVAPSSWAGVEGELLHSSEHEIVHLAQALGLSFGSTAALESLRSAVSSPTAQADDRKFAFDVLLQARDAGLPPLLPTLLRDPVLRAQAIRAAAVFNDPQTPEMLLGVYASLTGGERRDVLNTLVSRAKFAKPLMDAAVAGTVPKADFTADLVRQLLGLRDDTIRQQLVQVWGVMQEQSPDMQKEIERYRGLYWAGGSTPGDAPRGRVVFNKVCAQCHHLFDFGGQVGPDITGANRGDLDYLLQNILFPNAVIPNEYRATRAETKDGRVIVGIQKGQTGDTVKLQTANELVELPKSEIEHIETTELSMMPEGLLANLKDQEMRDLLYYLSRVGQVPLPAGN
jgi:putative heme-binding domain-containing protein